MFDGLGDIAPNAQQIQLNSLHFFLLSTIAIGLARVSRGTSLFGVLVSCLNLYFLYFIIPDLKSALVLGALVVGTFGIGQLRARLTDHPKADTWGKFFGLSIVGLWVLLFMIKDPSLLAPLNPFYNSFIQIIGISYLMFRAINYVSDVEIMPKHSFFDFLNYMIFFPTLLAGPIERFDRFLEYRNPKEVEPLNEIFLPSLHRIATGLIKKFVLADNLAIFSLFSDPSLDQPVAFLWVKALSLLLILYLDFSGYCDIVIGVSRLMGIKICENFNLPFLATNIQDFWGRWHISMSSFVRDYVFTPLSRIVLFRVPKSQQFAAVTALYFFTMLVIALWHNTTWGFLIFGLLHGFALVVYQLKRKYFTAKSKAESQPLLWVARAGNYVFICLTMAFWVLKPADSLNLVLKLFGMGS